MESRHTPKTIKSGVGLHESAGPVFEFGPGWGAKSKKWIKKYLFGGNCTLCRMTRYVLLLGILILLFGGPQIKSIINKSPKENPLTRAAISETVQKGDSKTTVARRALADYLDKNPASDLSPGKKIFVENRLVELMGNTSLKTGQTVDFKVEDLIGLINEAEQLSPSALEKWEEYAKTVKF